MSYANVRRFAAEILGVDEAELSPDTRLDRTGGFDAITLAKLIIRCEDALEIAIFDEDALDFPTLGALSDHIGALRTDGSERYSLPSDRAREAWYYE